MNRARSKMTEYTQYNHFLHLPAGVQAPVKDYISMLCNIAFDVPFAVVEAEGEKDFIEVPELVIRKARKIARENNMKVADVLYSASLKPYELDFQIENDEEGKWAYVFYKGFVVRVEDTAYTRNYIYHKAKKYFKGDVEEINKVLNLVCIAGFIA